MDHFRACWIVFLMIPANAYAAGNYCGDASPVLIEQREMQYSNGQWFTNYKVKTSSSCSDAAVRIAVWMTCEPSVTGNGSRKFVVSHLPGKQPPTDMDFRFITLGKPNCTFTFSTSVNARPEYEADQTAFMSDGRTIIDPRSKIVVLPPSPIPPPAPTPEDHKIPPPAPLPDPTPPRQASKHIYVIPSDLRTNCNSEHRRLYLISGSKPSKRAYNVTCVDGNVAAYCRSSYSGAYTSEGGDQICLTD